MKLKLALSLIMGFIFVFFLFYFIEKEKNDRFSNEKKLLDLGPNVALFTCNSPGATPFNENELNKAYRLGYEKGYYSFILQNEQDSDEKITEYMVSVENLYKENNSKEYTEALQQGYVDGYHKACDKSYCPRPD